jgi:hypothetical protein
MLFFILLPCWHWTMLGVGYHFIYLLAFSIMLCQYQCLMRRRKFYVKSTFLLFKVLQAFIISCALSLTPSILIIINFNISFQATFKPPKAIRGGIQICFPQVWSSSCFGHVSFGSGLSTDTQMNNFILQLGSHGVLEQHGFARNRFWSVDESPPPFPVATSNCHIDLILKSSQEDLKIWPYRSASTLNCLIAMSDKKLKSITIFIWPPH